MSGYILVPISNGQFHARISVDDADLAVDHKWFKWRSPNGTIYARRNGKVSDGEMHGKSIYLHSEIATRIFGEVPRGRDVDHINRNSLDCRRNNIRIVSRSVNRQNTVSQRGEGTFKGVHKREGRSWRARINSKNLGTFASAEEAALAYDRAALDIYGSNAATNQQLGLVSPDEGQQLNKANGRSRRRPRRVDNQTGYSDILKRQSGTYRARIRQNGKVLWDRSGFETPEEAFLARQQTILELGVQ